jgi:hypothetical protein
MTEEDKAKENVFVKNTDIRKEISTDKQKSGILNRALQGWINLLKKDGFDKKWDDPEYVKNLWTIDINPVALFVKECCETDPSYKVKYDLFYETLNNFRESRNAKKISNSLMTRKMNNLGIKEFDDRKRIKYAGETIRHYGGIKIKEEALKEYAPKSKKDKKQETLMDIEGSNVFDANDILLSEDLGEMKKDTLFRDTLYETFETNKFNPLERKNVEERLDIAGIPKKEAKERINKFIKKGIIIQKSNGKILLK